MAVQRIDLKDQSVSMDGVTADRLIRLGSGDAALLYLYLLRAQGAYDPAEAGRALGWKRAQLDAALAQLGQLGLAKGAAALSAAEPVPVPDQAPEYTAEEIAAELRDQNGTFAALLREVENLFGRRLTTAQVSILLELYDYVGLPGEVLFTLISWLNERNRKKYGPGKRLSMSYVKRVGYQWKENGYDTLEAADEYIASVQQRESREGAMLAALSIYGRPAAAGERRFLQQWLEWGFPAETVAVAYDITLTNTGRMNWNYCNAILRRGHEKGLHTPQEVRSEHKSAPRAAAPAGQHAAARQPSEEELASQRRENQRGLAEMKRVLERMRQSEE